MATLLIIGTYMLITYNRTMPFAEGWYSYYARVIADGNVPYVDFEYLFMPFYMYLITGFTTIFGFKIIALRILGAILFMAISWMLYKIFREFFNPLASTLAAVVSALYLQSESAQVFYDYIRFMDLFAFTSIYFLIRTTKNLIEKGPTKTLVKNAFFAGLFIGLVLLTKQNVGMILMAYLFLLFMALLLYLSEKGKVLKAGLAGLAGTGVVVAGLASFLLANNAVGPFLNFTIFKAVEAKGGTFTVLFSWIIRGIPVFAAQLLVALIVFVFLYLSRELTRRRIIPTKEGEDRLLIAAFALVSVFSTVVFFQFAALARLMAGFLAGFSYAIYLFVVLLFVWLVGKLIKGKRKGRKEDENRLPFITFLGAIISIGYAVGMSGGLAESQVTLALGLLIALGIHLSQHRYHIYGKGIILILALILSQGSMMVKYISPYSWWGMDEPVLWENTETSIVPLLEGIKMSPETKNVYDAIYSIVNENSTAEDRIFAFPHIPIFYVLTDRQDPGTFTKVQWFDVSTDYNVTRDINVLLEKPPKIILIYNLPEYVHEVHEELFNNNGSQSGLSKMLEALEEIILPNEYTLVSTQKIDFQNSIDVYVRK